MRWGRIDCFVDIKGNKNLNNWVRMVRLGVHQVERSLVEVLTRS